MTVPAPFPDPIGRVEETLFDFLAEQRRVLADAAPLVVEMERVARAGGKRLRPAFAIWGYRAGGGTDAGAIVRAAACLELLHTFALIHDDVMDRSPLRRGAPASYRHLAETMGLRGDTTRFGLSAAILVGDLAMALADDLWWSAGFPPAEHADATARYHRLRAEVIGGQYLDLLAAARGDATPEETRRISVLKSGRYTVEGPLLIGAALAGASEQVRATLATYGAPLGEAFQLRDDILGAFGDPDTTGKDAYSDLREGKQTLLVALARKNATGDQKRVMDDLLGKDDLTDDQAEQVRDVLRATGAVDGVKETVADLLAQATGALDAGGLPADATAALRTLAVDAVVRDV